MFLLSPEKLIQVRIRFLSVQTMDEVMVAAPGYAEELTHSTHWVLIPMQIDDIVFCLWPHSLSAFSC